MDHEDAYDMTTYDEEIVINGDDDHYHSKIVEEAVCSESSWFIS